MLSVLRRPRKNVIFLQVVLLISILIWQLGRLQRLEVVDLEEVSARGQWPPVVAATIFLMEFVICFVLILLLRLMLHFKDPGSGEVVFLLRLRQVAETLAFIAFFAGVYYVYVLCRGPRISMGCGSFVAGKKECRDPRHILLWTFLAPHQWVMHCRLYMKASVLENLELLVHTTYVMVFGLVAVQVDMTQEDAFIAPHWQVRIAFTLSCLCMLSTFAKAWRLPLEPVTAQIGHFFLKVKCAIWTMYPVIYALRSADLITYWHEEVLLYPTLDLTAKSLSLIASSTGPLFTLFVNTWGHWHVSVGEHDFRVTVDDPGWDVQSVVMDRTEENVLGLKAGSNFLRDAVHADDRKKLQLTAKQVDKQLSFMAQKTPLTVILGDVEAPAECYVSRSLWGSRQLAITLLVFGEGTMSRDVNDEQSWSIGSSMASSPAGDETSPREHLTLGKVALHEHLTSSSQQSFWRSLPSEVRS